ncbi:putative C-S lyase [Sulfurimonas lithotrophica]|uniref:cysteine-S-conjugate beta-lyase n=1 Tax=Sulfurimonas lithotrophica TaxID=2590022 RepID=A0A5P8NZ35_9BACT|nr:PatB family C-S lyase [Sulfurimonas lithotrophica]QFR48702.1 putative C-S lyase [Sulfurimonas lithotrophica]
MSYSFKKSACRKDTNAEKYKLREKLFGTEDVEPVWVADMDIDTPDFVTDAIKKRLNHPVFGYEDMPESAYEAQIDWLYRHHGIKYEVVDMLYSHSVVASMHTAIEAFSKVGDKIIVQTPVYPPFFKSVTQLDRKVLVNPLKLQENGIYTFDLDDLESQIDEKTKMILLCSPHNPVGRVWKRDELESLLEICLKHNIVIFSDEIHSDLVYAPNKHIPFASISKKAKDITVSTFGVGKTFNMAGFAISTVAIANEELRDRFLKAYSKVHFAQGASLSHVAFEAAYKNGDVWLSKLKEHLRNNYTLLKKLCDKYPQFIKITPIEATYLAWLDCRGMGLRDKELRDFFIKNAKLGLNAGIAFGKAGSGFMRLNFALSSDKMSKVIQQLESALKNRKING